MSWQKEYLGKVCGFYSSSCVSQALQTVFLLLWGCSQHGGLSRCALVPGSCRDSGPKSKAETSVTFPTSVLAVWLFPHSARGCSEGGYNPAAIISSNGIPVSRNPLRVNEDIGPFLSPCSSGLAAGCCVCLISPWGCLSGFIPVFFLQCDSSAVFASTACSCLLKFKLFLLSAFLPAYQYSLWVCLNC